MPSFFLRPQDVTVDSLSALCERRTSIVDFPHANTVEHNVPVYEGAALHAGLPQIEFELRDEWARCLHSGPGILVVRSAYQELDVIDRATDILQEIVTRETATGKVGGDHFGTNTRVWNALQKMCLLDPQTFTHYFGNPFLRLASEAWLGPAYRITAQMNNIKPGGPAQSPHRDYHLGFQNADTIVRFPLHAQVMSQFLTLQGAVAHCHIPPDRGATMFLPYSQLLKSGYWACQRPDFSTYFSEHFVQPSLRQGDMIFFSPAVFHAGGENRTKQDRIANLLQISSAFGRTMESIDHLAMLEALYPALLRLITEEKISDELAENAVRAAADGYAFPTNLDSDPPIGGNAPTTQQDLVWDALHQRKPVEALRQELAIHAKRRLA